MKEDKFAPESAVSIFDSFIVLCDVIIAGKDCAVGLKYDEENMFAPMIVLIEKDTSANTVIWAAESLAVPVVKNVSLAKNISSYGKAGGVIPEASFREVSLILTRPGSARQARRQRGFKKNRRQIPEGIAMKIPVPLSVEMGASLFTLTGEGPGRDKLLADPLNIIRRKLIKLLGIPIPAFRFSLKTKLKDDEYRILFKGLEAGRGRLELCWYAQTGAEDPERIAAAAKSAAAMLVRHAGQIIQRRSPELLGRDEVEAILDAAEEKYPVVTGEVKSLLSLGIIREILQSLVSEQVSIRHIAVILETLADWGSFGPAPSDLIIEQIRQSLKRQICLEYADDKLTLRVLTLEPKLEKKFADIAQDNSEGEDLSELISSAVKGMDEKGFPPVILCSPKVRAPVKEATRRKLPNLAVLSYVEIPSDISVEPLGEIRLNG